MSEGAGATAAQGLARPAATATWRVDADGQTLALASPDGRLPVVVHWGAPLPPGEDVAALLAASWPDVTGGQPDAPPALSLCPGEGWPGQPGLLVRAMDGTRLHPRFRHVPGAGDGLLFADAALGLRLLFVLEAQGGVVACRTVLESDAPVILDWLCAPAMPASAASTHMEDIHGRWIGEMRAAHVPWRPGAHGREGRTGRTGHEDPPYLLLAAPREDWAMHYGWSGGHRMVAEQLSDGRRHVQWGHAMGSEAPGTRFETGTLHLAWSAEPEGCAVAFQRHLRDHVVDWPDPARPRPVHYNCWEAVYFDHDPATLRDIATRAAALGAERFVLDDGWFGRRDDDTSSLGDWTVDRRKWPDGLGPFIAHVRAQDMTFGLWVEPEMANPDSDLLRARPDWVLGPADQVTGRGQLCLDMGRGDVRDHLFAALDALLREHAIDYLKWDHNRALPHPDAAQARGTYALIDRLRAAHPGVEIETCASGGGRVDAGILARMHRVWLSDSNDPVERLRIQAEAARWLPAAVCGSHVGPRRCHTSGRVTDIRFRAWVAAQRHMGFEMDPRELTDEEARVLRDVAAWWKRTRDWRMAGDVRRLPTGDPAVIAEQQSSPDGARFVLFAGLAAAPASVHPVPLRLLALDPAARYRVDLLTSADLPALSRGAPALKDGPVEASGAWLMRTGLTLPWAFPETMHVLEGERL